MLCCDFRAFPLIVASPSSARASVSGVTDGEVCAESPRAVSSTARAHERLRVTHEGVRTASLALVLKADLHVLCEETETESRKAVAFKKSRSQSSKWNLLALLIRSALSMYSQIIWNMEASGLRASWEEDGEGGEGGGGHQT